MPQITLTFAYDTRDNRTSLTDNRNGQIAHTCDEGNRKGNLKVKHSARTLVGHSNYTCGGLDKRTGISDDPDGAGPWRAVQMELFRHTWLQKGQ